MGRRGPRPGWYRDPTGRHELRRWDGDGWSEWVIDASRRNFDDIDGCGGPPAGDPVPVDGGGGGPRRRAGGGGRRRLAPGGVRGRSGAAGGVVPLAEGIDLRRGFWWALATTAAATAAALTVVGFSSGGVVEAMLSSDPMGTLRRFAGHLVLAAAAFEIVLAVGLLIAIRSNPTVSLRRVGREELLRGFITFLLALFAWTFFVGAIDGGSGDHWWPVALGPLFLAEVALTVVVAPVLEERLFRGLLLAGLRDRFGPVVGVLGQAAIYGAAHVWAMRDASRPATVIGMAAVGAVFGWMAHTTNDLRPVVVGHVMFGSWVLLERVLGW